MSRLIKASLKDEFESILDFITNQDTFDEVFYDDNDNEYSCRSLSLIETEFYYVDSESGDDASRVVDNVDIKTIDDIEKIFNELKDEADTDTFVREGYVGDINTDDDLLEELFWDIADCNDPTTLTRESDEWIYKVRVEFDKITINLFNKEEDTKSSVIYTDDEFNDIEIDDFITDITEACYYAY